MLGVGTPAPSTFVLIDLTMAFKDLKKDDVVYFYDTQSCEATTGIVDAVQPIRYKVGEFNKPLVDVNVNIDGNIKQYVFPANIDVTWNNKIEIFSDKERFLSVMKYNMKTAKDILDNQEKYKAEYESYCKVLETYDTEYKEQKQTAARLDKLERSIEDIKDAILNLSKN